MHIRICACDRVKAEVENIVAANFSPSLGDKRKKSKKKKESGHSVENELDQVHQQPPTSPQHTGTNVPYGKPPRSPTPTGGVCVCVCPARCVLSVCLYYNHSINGCSLP